jgi:hypothetical protein
MDGMRASDKLQAALHRDPRLPNSDLGQDYRDACAAWFAGLSEQDKSVAKAAADTYRNGYQMRAKQIAAALPPAPRYPLD